MDELDPLSLDRRLARAVLRWRAWRRRLDRGLGFDEDPFELDETLAGRTTFQALDDLPDADPLKSPLARWVYRLAEQRIDREALMAVAASRRLERHAIEKPEQGRYSLAELLERSLSEPQRPGWLQAYIACSKPLAERAGRLWERRAEIARRMGLESPDAVELAPGTTYEPAVRWLAASADMAGDFLRPEPGELVELALGRDASDGWPARITPRTVAALLGESQLLDSVRLDPGPMPRAVGASSFLRALYALGVAWREALAPGHQPFVIAHDPYQLESHATGALFASLALSLPFTKRQLGLGSSRAREHRRNIARVALLESRAAALRALLRPAALAGQKAFREAYEAKLHDALGVELHGDVAGALWRLRIDDVQRFEACLLAAGRAAELTEAHDEDWFRNPRAVDQLRSEAELSPAIASAPEALERGAEALREALAEALG